MLKDPYTLSWRVMKAATTAVILFSLSSLVCTCNYVGLSLKRSYKRDIDLKLYVCVCGGGGGRERRGSVGRACDFLIEGHWLDPHPPPVGTVPT